MSKQWHPDGWQSMKAMQQPAYADQSMVKDAVQRLSALPPLVSSWEVEALRESLAEVGRGKAFLLQGGDCAESFDECNPETIAAKLKILLQMSLVLVHGTRKPVIRVGRIAGQYAKPRSSDEETIDGVTLPSYRGDLINGLSFTAEQREPDPMRMVQGYHYAALTLNFIRALADGGFGDLHHPENWQLEFVKQSNNAARFNQIVSSIRDSISFMKAVGGVSEEDLRRANFFTSHEALLLHYEAAQTRKVPRRVGWYNLSTHMPWIGMRTALGGGAHVEYCRGIANPVGVKVGPTADPKDVASIVRLLNPSNQEGKIVLIHRMGATLVGEKLRDVLSHIAEESLNVVWCCDPMHGNTETTDSGLKTRRFTNILSELEASFAIHKEVGTYLGGVHFELTGDDVTECVGGARKLTESDLRRAYESRVDPRLNCDQALEMALSIASILREPNG